MRFLSYIYDSSDPAPHVDTVLDLVESFEEEVDLFDVATAGDRKAARREAILEVKEAVRIGSAPDSLFDEHGTLDFSTGVLISEEPTGRRSLHIGTEALETLREER